MILLDSSSGSIFPGNETRATEVVVTLGGPKGWPKTIKVNYVSPENEILHSAKAQFEIGKLGRPVIVYNSTELNKSFELQCYWFKTNSMFQLVVI